ncbi:MAG: hypothetical protein Q9161_001523 [Pseudevernia consocians]
MAGGVPENLSRSPVVIVGGGMMGFATAYYLALARKSGRSITIVDNASILFAGASGKANGILGDYGFEPEAESLGKLSWELHQQLARVHRGRAGWHYRDVEILRYATVADVRVKNGSLESVTITQLDRKIISGCHSLIIAAGPWSERVLSGLFPDSRVRIPSVKPPNSGNYIILRAPRWDSSQDTRVCHQIYLEGKNMDISSRPDGTLYIGGSLSAQEALPDTTTDVHTQLQYVRKMEKLVASVLDCSMDDIEVLEVGRAYRPCLEHGRPIVSQVPLDELLGMTCRNPIERSEVKRGGVYLNVGHGCDGITLGPGSGKVMSELIEGGQSMSADISGLGIL